MKKIDFSFFLWKILREKGRTGQDFCIYGITHLVLLASFYTICKDEKSRGFLMFSGGIKKRSRGMKWVNVKSILFIVLG